MAEQQKQVPEAAVGFYTDTYREWTNIFSKVKSLPFPIQIPIQNKLNKSVFKSLISGIEIYEAWLKGLNGIVEKSFDVNCKLLKGENIELDEWINASENAFNNLNIKLINAFEGTSFEGIKQVNEAIKKSSENFTQGKKTAKEFAEELIRLWSKTINLFRVSNGKTLFSDMLSPKNGICDEDYQKTADMYKKIIDYSGEIFRPFAVLHPAYKNITDWTKKSTEISVSFMEMNLKPYWETRRGVMEFYDLLQEILEEDNSIEEFHKKWIETADKAKRIFNRNSQSYERVSDFINKNTEFITSALELYRSANGYDKNSQQAEVLNAA